MKERKEGKKREDGKEAERRRMKTRKDDGQKDGKDTL